MYVNFKLDPQFTVRLQKLIVDHGEMMAKLNGFADDQMSYTDFIDNFIDKQNVADASIDANANVKNKDIRNLINEMSKPHAKLIAFNKLFYELKKEYGLEVAEKWLEGEYIGESYLHDASTSTFIPYCYAYDLERLANEGLFFIQHSFNPQPPKHLETWTDFVGEFVSWTSNRTSGACGLPNFLIYSYYFWKKDCDEGYYMKSPEYYRDQEFQRIIFKLNQPYLRIDQSAFTNFSIFDENYLVELFGGKQFPDGSYMVDSINEIKEYQKAFMKVLADVRAKCAMTFPVMSYNLLFQNGKFVDEEFAKWCCKHNMQWGDSNFACFDEVTSLSNCCRLKSDIKQLGYFNSIGATALSVGSVKVNTVNLARIAYEVAKDVNVEDTLVKAQITYCDKLKQRVELALDCLDRVRHIIKRNVAKGLLTNYDRGLIDIANQYNTVGIIGVYETLEKFRLVKADEFGYHYYTEEGLAFAVRILSVIQSTIDDWRRRNAISYNINIEQIPAERAAAVLQKKDEHFFPTEPYTLPLYGNQWIPLGIKCTLQEKIRITAILDKACSGGAIGHFNLSAPFKEFDDAWKMLNYVASQGCQYFAFNYKISVCRHNHSFFSEFCPYCGEKKHTVVQRIVGFLVPYESYSKERKAETDIRTYFDPILN